MVETITIIIFCISFIAGFVLALSFLIKNYQKKVIDVLDYLLFSKKIEEKEYKHYKEKYVTRQDSLKNLTDTIKKLRGKGEKERLDNNE